MLVFLDVVTITINTIFFILAICLIESLMWGDIPVLMTKNSTQLCMLILIFGHNAVAMVFFLLFERQNSGKNTTNIKWLTYCAGFVSHTFGWGTILSYFIMNLINRQSQVYVNIIIFLLFILDNVSVFLLGFVQRNRRLFPYCVGEVGFVFLSLISKNILTWVNYSSHLDKVCLWGC